jgi:tRNA A37 N6-isopentenylltransferase MiaA
VVAYLAGRRTAAEALAEMQRVTRNFARRQLTWFRRESTAEWVTVHGWEWVEPLAEKLLERLMNQRTPSSHQPGRGSPGSRNALEVDR